MIFSVANNDKIHNRTMDFIFEPYKKSNFDELKLFSAGSTFPIFVSKLIFFLPSGVRKALMQEIFNLTVYTSEFIIGPFF